MYPRNAASPERIAIGQVILIADGTVQTSGVSIVVRPQGGAEAAGGGTTAYGADGTVYYTPTQAETNYTSFVVIAYKTSCLSVSQTIITTASATPGKVVLSAETHTGAVVPTVSTLTGHTPQTGDSYARIGATGSGLTSLASAAALATAQSDLNIITGSDGVTIASSQGAITFGAITISVTGATNNITLSGSGSGAGMAFTRGGTSTLFNAAWAAAIQQEAADALTAYDPPTYAELLQFVQLLTRKDAALVTDLAAVIAAINANTGSGTGSYSNQTDSLEASQGEHDYTQANMASDYANLTTDISTVNTNVTSLNNVSTADLLTQALAALDTAIGTPAAGSANEALKNLAARLPATGTLLDDTTTFAEIGQEAPAATASIVYMIRFLYKLRRNLTKQTSTEFSLYNDAGTVVDQKATVSSDGTTATKGEIGTGP